MPSSKRSFAVTEAYRDRIIRLDSSARTAAGRAWGGIDLAAFDASYERWIDSVVPILTLRQRSLVALSAGYLTAFLSSEAGRRVRTIAIDSSEFAGLAADGRSLVEALGSPKIAVLKALKERADNAAALRAGWLRAERMVGLALDHAAQGSLFAGMREDDRFIGWRRVPRGTCGACLGDTRTFIRDPGEPMRRHPNCKCVAEPGVRGFVQRYHRPSGDEIFAAMTLEEQEASVGATVAAAIRSGEAELASLVATNEQKAQPDFITQKPAVALT